jgi:Mg-chelatase subunit ChlD
VLTEQEREAVRDAVLDKFEAASKGGGRKAGRDKGDGLLGSLLTAREADRAAASRVPWNQMLSAALAESAERVPDGDRVWVWGLPDPLTLPGIMRPAPEKRAPLMLVVVDTSGSMAEDLPLCGALIEEACIAAGGRIIVGFGDVSLDALHEHFAGASIHASASGGTRMEVVVMQALAACRARGEEPGVCILLTDGYTDYPEQSAMPGRELHVVCTTNASMPAWCKTYRTKG